MDYLFEAVALGIDAIAFGAAYHMFQFKKSAIKSIENVQYIDIDGKLLDHVSSQPGKKLDYVVVRGKVKALSSPIRSQNAVNTFGVVQKFTTKEHLVTRHNFGFWSERERIIQEVYNSIPFALQNGNVDIEVADALSAYYLDLETISDVYEPSSGSFFDFIWGFFTGVRPQGLQKTEEMVREGVLMTGIGELALSEDQGSLRLQPSQDGLPFFLTSMPISTLSKKLESEKQTFKYLSIILGILGLGLAGMMAHRYCRQWINKRKEEEQARRREQTRKERRQRARPGEELPDSQLCIVCRENPKEVVLLPCGHVCICEDCSEDISDLCPVCRAEILSRNPAYIS
ncbi:Mitochondrial E3 ubiquitin protein ligase 1 [Frankliniella fusca]|uniref:RING-type E3 ubiquitin transferase n=1 Tax=Frankliniella fusca TaxID=407009 RepID=A0AAE1LJN0_9NEOP|nr:Mitochondrial E3 ubiquitin protein ligase 1 [Frankliniella fusca]